MVVSCLAWVLGMKLRSFTKPCVLLNAQRTFQLPSKNPRLSSSKKYSIRDPGDGENRDDKERPVSLKTSGEMMLGIGKKRWRYPWYGAVMLT